MPAKRSTPPERQRRRRPRTRTPRLNCLEFRPGRGAGREYKIRRIPAPFWDAVTTKARREGVSLRGLVLRYLQQWVEAEPPRRRRAA